MIIDCHTHVYTDRPIEAVLALADRVGIDKVFVSHTFAISYDMQEGNRVVADAVKRYPDRVFGYVAISSARYGQAALDELVRGVEKYGLHGLKLVHRVGGLGSYELITPLDEPAVIPLIEKAADLKVPSLLHASPQEVETLALRVPEATLIMAHSGGCPTAKGDWHRAIMAAERCPNILLDTASSLVDFGYIEALVEAVGPERVVFGTDMPLLDPFAQLSKVEEAELEPAARRMILSENIARVVKRECLAPAGQ